MRNRRAWRLLGLLSLLAASVARAAPPGSALLIGDDGPGPGKGVSGCAQTVAELGGRLEQLGLAVRSLVSPTAASLQDALDAFADEAGATPSGTSLIYVCAPAVAQGPRLFILPSGAGTGPADLQTEGVVLQALLNTLAGAGGTLYADLRVTGDTGGERRPRLPDGLRLALNEDAQNQPHLLGTALSAPGFPLGQDWPVIVSALGPAGSGLVIASAAPAPAPGLDGLPLPAASQALATEAQPKPSATQQTLPGDSDPKSNTAANLHGNDGRNERRNRYGRLSATPDAGLPASPRTARIEAALARRGVYAGPADGKYTPAVAEAVRSFQRQLGDPPTGVLTRVQIARLLNS